MNKVISIRLTILGKRFNSKEYFLNRIMYIKDGFGNRFYLFK